MNIDRLEQLISDYLDDALPPSKKLQVEKLIESDENARNLYQRLSKATRLLSNLHKFQAPPFLEKKILRNIKIRSQMSFYERMKQRFTIKKFQVPVFLYTALPVLVVLIITLNYTVLSPREDILSMKSQSEYKYNLSAPAENLKDKKGGAVTEDRAEGQQLSEEADEPVGELESAPMAQRRLESKSEERIAENFSDQALAEKTEYEETQEMAKAPSVGMKREKRFIKLESHSARSRIYRAEPMQIMMEKATNEPFEKDEVVIIRGEYPELDTSSGKGSISNPILENQKRILPALTAIDFNYWDYHSNTSAILINGEAFLDTEGKIRYLKLFCEAENKSLLETYADYLKSSRLMPSYLNGQPQAVYFSFIVTIYPQK